MAANELQAALYTALTVESGDANRVQAVQDLFALVGARIYDDVPDNEDDFPYVVIGEDELSQWDTDGSLGFRADVTIHVWSRSNGFKETKDVQSAIYRALHNFQFDIADYQNVLCQQTFQQTLRDPDGKTRHGVQTYHTLMAKL